MALVPRRAGVRRGAGGRGRVRRTAAALAATGMVADLVPGPVRRRRRWSRRSPPGTRAGAASRGRRSARDVARPTASGQGVGRRRRRRLPDRAASQPSEAELAAARDADAVTFTSSSTVTNFLAAAGLDGVPPVVVCIGPITARTAEEAGLRVDVVADESTIDVVGRRPRP